MYKRILAILDSKEKIPIIGRVLNGLYAACCRHWASGLSARGLHYVP